MTPTTEPAQETPTKRTRWGKYLLAAGLILLIVLAFAPAPYVIRLPGPAYDALGTTPIEQEDGEKVDVDVISIDGAETFDAESGTMAVMTVNIQGTPDYQPSWFSVAASWFNPDKDVLPIEMYYPDGVSSEERGAENQAMMTQSQGTAIAAALTELGYEVDPQLKILDVFEEGPSQGILMPEDILVEVDGRPISDFASLQAEPLREEATEVVVLRDGEEKTLTVTPEQGEDDETPLLGVLVQEGFEFPMEVEIELGEVGGPSAGLIFALSIMEVLEEGELSHGMNIAGTGTMAADGEVGPIGGIRQKVYAAVDIDADYFLAPESNCAEALSAGVADQLPIYAVSSLEESLDVLEAEGTGNTEEIRTCEDALEANVPQV
ncbi:MAG: YlbL family protein [Gulosibacter sp.]|uniref:YlbL family protein n=1 Tax=Gulosibacter sp. TaxID=2817531 RepID=UPI003F91D232